MKKQFQSLTEKGRWLIATLTLLFTLGIGQMWADTEIFSWTATSALAKNASEDATGGTVLCTGSGMGSETPSGSGFYKFNSSTQLTFTLSSGTFAADDVISFTFTSGGNNKTVGVDIQEVSTQLTETVATKGTSVTKTYTVTASDGIQGQNKFSIKRVDSNFSFKSVSVTRASSGGCTANPAAPTKLEAGSITENSVTFSITDAADAGKYDLYYSMSSTAPASTATATATSTAKTKEITGLTASTEYYAWVRSVCDDSHKSAWVALTGGSFTTAAPDPCNKYFYFTKAADATTAGVTNNEGGFFTVSASGSNGTSGSIILDGKTYNCTNRTSNVSAGNSLATFTIPANKKGDLYGLLMSSGDGARGLLLDGVSTGVSCEGGTSALHNIVISNITSGTHTLTADGNARVGMFIMKVCDAEYHTITLDLDGGTGATSIQALDGAPATKPADPTKAHCAFAGWVVKSTSAAYDWSANVTGDLTLKATWTQLYTVTFANGGGSGDAPAAVADKAQGETFAVPANTFTAPEGKEFDKWNDGSADYAPGDTYTVGTDNVVLTAVWKQLVAKYTVVFKDGDTELGTKLFDVASNPSDADINKTKPLFTFAAWQKDEADIALDAAFWATVVKDATVTLTARWAKAYATSYDMEAYAVSDGASKSGLETALTAAGYAYTNINGIDNGHTHNYTYDGMKYKTNDGDLSFNVVAGKVVEVKTGHLPTNDAVTMYINGVADATVFEGADENIETHKTNYFYSAAEALYRLDVKASKGTCAVKAVTIRDPYQVTFNVDGGDPVSAQYGHPSITLPSASKGTDSFLGWFIGEDKIGEAGDSYTPTANVELVAHWETVSTDARLSSITFSSDAGTLVPAFDPEVTSYTYTMPYGTAAIPTITGGTAYHAQGSVGYIVQAENWGDVAEIRGIAASADTKKYQITMLQEPKDGVSLIKVATTGGTNKTVTGVYAGDGDVSLSSNTKMDKYKYIGFILDGTTLQAGDRINVHTSQAANTGGSHIIFYDNMTDKNELYETGEIGGLGDNIFTINAEMVGSATAYVYRANNDAAHQWNGYVDYIEVTRAMNPVLTAITIDGRDGEIDALDDKHFSVTIPYESELAALTVVPTVIRNAAHATTPEAVVSNAGAWILGDNTYRVMDKDGDYTDYTITLKRDVLKHTVSFNTHGGSAVASVEIEHNANLTAVPNDPSKEDYLFQYWSLTDGGEEVDVTTVQINEDKEFHAVWVSDGGIKLLDGSTVNHTNFITAVTATETVEFKGNTVNYAKFSGTCGSVSNVKDLTRVIAYNATTNKTKIRISAHNNSTSGRNILVKGLVEGASAAVDLATIALGNKEDKVSDWIEFDNAANRTIYIMVGSSAGDVYFTQVKVIESGETPMKQVGEAGYALNMNKGRFFGLANTDLAFEGLNARLSGDYTALNSGYAKLASTSMSFTVASDMNLVVTTNNSKTYYVTKGAAGTDNETAKKGVSEFDLTAGTWYITAGSDEVQFTNIAFELPKAAKPVVADMDDVEYCQGSAIDELAVSATVSDGGTMLYQWYKDGEIIAGAEAENYQPTADGEYYVEVVNTKTGYQNSDAAQSNTITVTGYAATVLSGTTGAENWPGEDATISVTASGKNLHYAWYTCDDAMGTNPVAVDPAVDAAELNVTIAAADTYYKVVVSGDCGDAQEAVITVVARQAVELQDVTGDMTWDFSKANDGTAAGSNLCNDEVLANVHGIVNNSDFKSDNIKATANKFSSGKLQASMIMFHTTVGGIVTVVFSHTGNNKTDGRALVVNGTYQSELSHNQTAMTYKCYVPAGDVVLTSTTGDGGAMLNFTSVDFKAKAEADYTRNVSNNIGTLCVDHNVLVGGAMGATFYQIASRNELYNDKIDFEEVLPNEELKAGEPYIFRSNTGKIELFYGETVATEPVAVRGMIGSFVNTTLDITEENKSSIMYIAQNKLWNCEDLVVSDLEVVANRAYIVMSDVPTYAEYQEALQQQQNPAPRRRVTLGRNAEQVATGIGEVQGDKVQSTKVLIDGHIYILRGEKMFDAKGQLVK